MKKLVFAVLGISLFLPALAGAAPAQTRWDMTIAGQIGIWAAWSDQNSAQIWNPGSTAARRTGTDENRTDEIGNLAAHVDPRLVFVIKGPQVWGAKSTARFEFDFFGAYPNTNGTARAKSTYINLEWPKDSILFGNGTSPFKNTNVGLPPGVAESVALPDAFGGTRAVQLMWEHRFGKGWTSQFALTHPNQEGFRHSTPAVPNPSIYSESNYPNAEAVLRYSSDLVGKIGNSNLTIALAGVYGRMRIDRQNSTDWSRLSSKQQQDGWYGQASFQIPIIAEKENNKARAVLLWLNASAGQGLPNYNLALLPGPYERSNGEYVSPRAVAYEGAVAFWFSNTVWMCAQYNSQDRRLSNFYKARVAGVNDWERNQLFNLALMYAPNPAVTLIANVGRLHTNYARPYNNVNSYKSRGTANAVHMGAIYYF